jgi:hypothetical protein
MLFRISAISHRLILLLLSSDGVLYILLKYQCHGNWSKHCFQHIIKTWYKSMQIKITKIPNFFSRTDDFPPPMDLRTFESLDDWSEIYDGGYGSSYVFNIVWNLLCLCLSGLYSRVSSSCDHCTVIFSDFNLLCQLNQELVGIMFIG